MTSIATSICMHGSPNSLTSIPLSKLVSNPNMSDQSDDSVDPLEEFSTEKQALDSFARRIFTKMKAKLVGSSSRC
jgi:hypothetical protein